MTGWEERGRGGEGRVARGGKGGKGRQGEERGGREERRQCWNGHKHVLKAHMSSKHSCMISILIHIQ